MLEVQDDKIVQGGRELWEIRREKDTWAAPELSHASGVEGSGGTEASSVSLNNSPVFVATEQDTFFRVL
jgi:hypothetical protein